MTIATAKCNNCKNSWEVSPTDKKVPGQCIFCKSIRTVTLSWAEYQENKLTSLSELAPMTVEDWQKLNQELRSRYTEKEWRKLYLGDFSKDDTRTETEDKS